MSTFLPSARSLPAGDSGFTQFEYGVSAKWLKLLSVSAVRTKRPAAMSVIRSLSEGKRT